MATLEEIFASMPEEAAQGVHDLLIIDAEARTIDVPETEKIFGVENDGRAETKYFQAPRYVGNGIDLAACFLRVNFQNANGDRDAYLVNDLAISGENVLFSWELSKKVTQYKGTVQFVLCANLPGSTKVADWHTTLAQGTVLEGLEPDAAAVEAATADVIAQLLQLVTSQTAAVEAAGAAQVANVQTEGTAQVDAVKAAAAQAEADALAEIEAKKQNALSELPADYTAMGNQVDKLTRTTAGAIVCEAEGQTIQVHDASDNYLHGLRIFGKSTQDGTPTPEAPVEIVSTPAPAVTVCGKNLAHALEGIHTVNGYTVTPNADGTITISGAAAAAVDTVLDLALWSSDGKNYTPTRLAANEHYTLCCWKDGAPTITPAARQLLADGTVKWGWSSVEAQDRQITKLYRQFVPDVGDTSMCGTYAVQIERGDAATEYEPYTGQTIALTNELPGIPVSSGGNYTDANGQQWVCDEVDLARGVYVQRVGGYAFLGNEEINTFDWRPMENGDAIGILYASGLNIDIKHQLGSTAFNGFSTHFKGISYNAIYNGEPGVAGYWDKAVKLCLRIPRSVAQTPEEWQSYLAAEHESGNPVTVQYVLAEPIEVALSEEELATWRNLHSVKPTTTILNDAGAHMAVEYVADTKLYIDRKLAELLAANNT